MVRTRRSQEKRLVDREREDGFLGCLKKCEFNLGKGELNFWGIARKNDSRLRTNLVPSKTHSKGVREPVRLVLEGWAFQTLCTSSF